MSRKVLSNEQKILNKFIGERVMEYRLKANVKRFPLAKAIGVTPIMIKRYEEGLFSISVSILLGICKALGNCTLSDLIPDERELERLRLLDPKAD